MEKWVKKGLIHCPNNDAEWAKSHAANPTAEHLHEDIFRIYYSTRDSENRSSIAWVDVDLSAPQSVLGKSEEPVLSPGELGMFDDCGVSIGCIVKVGKRRFLYYMGWNLAVTVPWKNELGLAISENDGAPFIRHSTFPVIRLNEKDPYTISYPWIIEKDGIFQMWYGSNLQWGRERSDMRHIIKYAESTDGIEWSRSGETVLGFGFDGEYAMCRPCVLHEDNLYKMWFCSRGDFYRIRYAESADGIKWERTNAENGLDVSDEGWDSIMVEYPCVFSHNNKRYMLYAGNGFGETGFGLACWE